MPSNVTGTIERIVREIGVALTPLEERLSAGDGLAFFEMLGVRLPPALASNGAFAAALGNSVTAARALATATTALSAAISANNGAQIVTAGSDAIDALVALIGTLSALGRAIRDNAGPLPGVDLNAFAGEVALRSVELLAVEYLETKSAPALGILALVGIVERKQVAAADNVPEHTRLRLHFERLGDLLSRPEAHFRAVYRWGEPAFDAALLLGTLHYLVSSFGLEAELHPDPFLPTEVEAYVLTLREHSATTPRGLEAALFLPIEDGYTATLPLATDWNAIVEARGRIAGGARAVITPPFEAQLSTPEGTMNGQVRFIIEGGSPGTPTVLFGLTGGSRLEAERVTITNLLDARVSGGESDLSFGAEAAIRQGKVIIKSGEGDSFLNSLLGGRDIESTFDLVIGASTTEGVYFRGSAALEIRLPLHLSLFGIELESLLLALGLSEDGTLAARFASSFKAQLGPLQAAVVDMGVKALFDFPPEGERNLGFARLGFSFLAPTGVGLAVGGGVFAGGGFLLFDPENGRYAGILHLEFMSIVSVTAVGLLDTRLPGGQQGFSLLIIISAEFTPIQLGFGFTLNGVGGLLGLNRTVNIERLRDGIRGSTLDSIMFPRDPIANANRIISDVREVFPPQLGRFVFGPFVRLGWGVPTLITLDLGLIIEVPDPVRLAIVGVLKMILPDPDTALIHIQVNFLGVVDFAAEELSFDASLYNSRLLTMTLSGDMAVRLRWGDDPSFILSVGGFHPLFEPPAGLTTLRRLTLALLPGRNPRLTLEAYLAVTSNTVQFGARLELYAEAGPFNVLGFLGLDVLFQFNPFYFIAQIEAGIAVRRGSSAFMSIRLRLTLSGPEPWNARGTGTISLLFFDVEVSFNVTWGDDRRETLPDVDVLPLLTDALGNSGNWNASFPAGQHLLVTTKDLSALTGAVLVHPFGVLTISQKLVPLDLTIDKFGHAKPVGATTFRITSIEAGSGGTQIPLATGDHREQFAPAQFLEMPDDEALQSKSFELLKGGVTTGASRDLRLSKVTTRDVTYEESIIDRKGEKLFIRFLTLLVTEFTAFIRGGAVSGNAFSATRTSPSPLSTPPVGVAQEGYVLVTTDTLSPLAGAAYPSRSEALSAYKVLAATRPALAAQVQIVPQYEVRS